MRIINTYIFINSIIEDTGNKSKAYKESRKQ